jgi:tetratricopeptide (TPR) repeat protein
MLHLTRGEWAQARKLSEHGFTVFKSGNVAIQLPSALAASAWAAAQLGEVSEALDQLRLGEEVVERFAATGIVAHLAWSYHALGRAALLLGRLDEARRLAALAIEFSPRHPGLPRTPSTCSATSRRVSSRATTRTPRPCTASRSPWPSLAACAR